jgi:hypothetical protein
MSSQNATCEALWRSSAEEGVAYTDDFPDVLLTRPELFDGSINQGQATHIRSSYTKLPNGKWRSIEEDNGKGLFLEVRRLLSWASGRSTDLHHRYGHGTKKYLTKAQPIYATSDWVLQWRNKADLSILYTLRGPYNGPDMEESAIKDTIDTTTLPDGGVRWTVDIDEALFHTHNTVEKLFSAEKELIRSRHPKQLESGSVQFTLTVSDGESTKTENSITDGWTSLRAFLDSSPTKKLIDNIYPIDGGSMHLSVYFFTKNLEKIMKSEFPLYGQRNMRASRMHMCLDGRMIEPRPLYPFLGKSSNHNDLNGYVGFANFVPASSSLTDSEKLPKPTTTKVMFKDECVAFQAAKRIIAEAMETHKPSCGWKNPKNNEPAPAPAPPAPESDDAESVEAPIPVPPAIDRLESFGISVNSEARGIICITANDKPQVRFRGTTAERDIMRKHASRAANADDAYQILMDLMAVFTR